MSGINHLFAEMGKVWWVLGEGLGPRQQGVRVEPLKELQSSLLTTKNVFSIFNPTHKFLEIFMARQPAPPHPNQEATGGGQPAPEPKL